jgi:predicted DNA-binding protein
MSLPQFSIRIPPELEQRVIDYAKENRTTKTRVMIDALAYYLGSIEDVPLSHKVMELEKRLTVLEVEVRGK